MKLKFFTFFTLLCSVQLLLAQHQVTGVVTDADSGETLIGASILVKGTSEGTVTDFDGNYTLQVADKEATLVFSYTGFSAQEIPLNGQTKLDVALSQGALLDEVVVTALGVVEKRSRLTYATQKLGGEEINASRIGDVSQQLSGQVPGLQISTGNGSGVSSSRIVLRGEASLNINKNEPLIIVDGVVISNNLDGIGGDATSWSNLPVDYGNGLTDFNTDDIEDVSVLKGPKAAALYGTRAANGALVIRTKSGANKQGLGIEFNTGLSFETLGNFWDEQTEFGGGFDNAFRANWGGNYGAPADGQLVSQPTGREAGLQETPAPAPYNKSLDRRGFFDTGVGYNNNLALSFANGDVWGRVSLAALSKTGIVPNSEYERRNVSVRLGSNVTEDLQVTVSANYVNSGSDNLPVIGGGGEGVINNMYWGMNNYDYNDFRDYWLPGQEGVQQNHFLTWGTNPWLIVNENLNGFNRNRLFGNIAATYSFSDNLSLLVRAGTDFYDDRRQSERPSGQPNFPNGMYREQNIGFQETNIDFLLTYNTDLGGNMGLKVTGGGNRMDQTFANETFETRDLGVPGVYNRGNAGDVPRLTQFDAGKRINSLYGSAQIDFDEKVYIDVTGRNDWSSALPLDNNSFFYPSVGVSALLSDMVNLPSSISYAQLRASWAATGNDTDPLLTQRVLSFGTLPSSVINPALLVNPELRPERTSAIEFGAEFRFAQDRMGIEVNYYNNVTTDQILQVPISQASGAISRLINAGEINNSGVEVFFQATPVKTTNFSWDVAIAWSRNRSEVIELTNEVESFVIAQGPSGGTVEARPGGRMGDIYGRGFVRDGSGNIVYDVVEVGGRDIVRPRLDSEIKNLGNYNPDWTAGITNTINFKNFMFRALLDYRNGGLLYTHTGALLYRSGIITESLPFRTQDFVPDGVIENADGSFSTNTISTTGQDFYRSYFQAANIEANAYDATFIKLREIAIGVDLKPMFPNLPVQNLNLSLFGRNLWIKTKSEHLRHYDPEALALYGGTLLPGFEVGQLPNPRTYGVNLRVGF
ncbi:MAG: SusC/RagA family TonB-linked outer membrane protein [Bacteroidota bacterium]